MRASSSLLPLSVLLPCLGLAVAGPVSVELASGSKLDEARTIFARDGDNGTMYIFTLPSSYLLRSPILSRHKSLSESQANTTLHSTYNSGVVTLTISNTARIDPLSDPTACIKALLDTADYLSTTLWANLNKADPNSASAVDGASRYDNTARINAWNGCGILLLGPTDPNAGAWKDISQRPKYTDLIHAVKALGDWMYEPQAGVVGGNMGVGCSVAVSFGGPTSWNILTVKGIPGRNVQTLWGNN